jgi:rhodanese-related sulfurtransferase
MNDKSAVGQAEKYLDQGYTNVKVLDGGVEAWKQVGYPLEE